MSLQDGIAGRYGRNGLSDLNPELVIALRGLKVKIWFVNSAAPAGGNGASWDSAVRTLQEAITLATANDYILLAPGHAESVTAAGGITFASRAGLTVVGQGTGTARPTFTFTTVVGADIDFDAANIIIINALFVAGIDALTGPLDINAADVSLVDCETRDLTGSYQTVSWVVTDANASRFRLVRPTHRGTTDAGATNWMTLVGGDGLVVEDPIIDGNFSGAAIQSITTLTTNFLCYGGQNRPGYIRNRNAADTCVVMLTGSTGFIGPNLNGMLTDNAANITEAFVGDAMVFVQPINICNLPGESTMQTNITASTDA